MLRDWGSREGDFIALTRSVRQRLIDLAGAAGTHTCVPIQGSGTFAVEAMLGTLVPRAGGRVLILVNGAYGHRIADICRTIGRDFTIAETAEDTPPSLELLDRCLADDGTISHVAVVHCETTTGILNPLEEIAGIVARHRRRLLIDAMSSFGALPVDVAQLRFDGLAASANKCLEGVPGLCVVSHRSAGFVSGQFAFA